MFPTRGGPNYSSSSLSASTSSSFGMAGKEVSGSLKHSGQTSKEVISSQWCHPEAEWRWTGLLENSKFLKGLTWGVSCMKTECRENQDGWVAQVYATTTACEGGSSSTATADDSSLVLSNSAEEIAKQGCLSNESTAAGGSNPAIPPSVGTPSYSFTWNHELTSLRGGLGGRRGEYPIIPPLVPSHRSGLSSSSASSLALSTNGLKTLRTKKKTYVGSSTFVVLDGHGAGGRDAAAAIEKAFDVVFSRADRLNGYPHSESDMLNSVSEALQTGQKMIEQLNTLSRRDFGTTCVSVTIVNDTLLSSSCGDSSALLLAFPPGSQSKNDCPLIIELSRRHNLEDRDELQRISDEGLGRVIKGDGGVLRLIPGDVEYDEAKRRGLSINMGRSLGHYIFNRCGLSNEVDFSFLALKQIPRLLESLLLRNGRNELGGLRSFRLPPLSMSHCHKVIDNYNDSQLNGTKSSRPSSSVFSCRENIPTRNSLAASRRAVARDIAASSGEHFETDNNGRAKSGLLKCFSRRPLGNDRSRSSVKSSGKLGDLYLLLMSDGVTDVLSSTCIVDLLRDFDWDGRSKNRSFDPSAFALMLTEIARERRAKACQRPDNCTCLVVHLVAKV